MRLFVLGRLDLRDNADRRMHATLAQPKRCALLTYLALCEPSAPVLRDTLCGVFWPDLTQEHARHALSQALYGLRRALGSAVVESGRGGQVGLAGGALWCDAATLHEALEAGRDVDALDLYRGELLPGLFLRGDRAFESWLSLERERLRRGIAGAVSRLTTAAERDGRIDVAIAYAYRGVELLPDDEAGLRRLITLLGASGDRFAAERSYEAFAARLADDLHLVPSPRTEELIASIRSADLPAPLFAAPQSISVAVTTVAPTPPARSPAALTGVLRRTTIRGSRSLAALMALVALVVFTVRVTRRGGPPPASSAAMHAAMLTRVGRFFVAQRTPASLTTALEQFHAAIRSDSAYAPAYSGLADAYILMSWYDRTDLRVAGPAAHDAALHAVALDSNLAEARASLGAVYAWIDGSSAAAARQYQRALRLDPRYPLAHDWYALLLAGGRHTDSAVNEARMAHDLDPTSLAIGADFATVLLWAGRDNAAIAQWQNTLQLDSTFERAHTQLWHTYALTGRWDAAVDELERLLRFQRAPAQVRETLRRVYTQHGWEGVVEWRLRALSSPAHDNEPRPVEAALLCVLLGRREAALAWLKRAYDSRDQYLRFAALDPGFAALRGDPRFLALLPAATASF